MTDPIHGAGGVQHVAGTPAAPRQPVEQVRAAFDDVLAAKLAERTSVRFSGHALERVQRRGIELDGATLGRLSGGVARAAAKGGRESLVLVDGTAFVVSVPNRTVITAVDREHMREHVFTNIDSAVIA